MAPKRPENAKEWLARWEKRRMRAFDNYQATGIAKYDAYEEECQMVCDALRAYIEAQDERVENYARRMTNFEWQANRLIKNSYSKEEVIKMLRDAAYW